MSLLLLFNKPATIPAASAPTVTSRRDSSAAVSARRSSTTSVQGG